MGLWGPKMFCWRKHVSRSYILQTAMRDKILILVSESIFNQISINTAWWSCVSFFLTIANFQLTIFKKVEFQNTQLFLVIRTWEHFYTLLHHSCLRTPTFPASLFLVRALLQLCGFEFSSSSTTIDFGSQNFLLVLFATSFFRELVLIHFMRHY